MHIVVWIDSSDESMVGGEGWGQYDARESISEFGKKIQSMIAKEYPKSSSIIKVEQGTLKQSTVYDDDGIDMDNESEYLRYQIGQIWEEWAWLAEA